MKLPESSSVPILHVLLREVCTNGYSKKFSPPFLYSSILAYKNFNVTCSQSEYLARTVYFFKPRQVEGSSSGYQAWKLYGQQAKQLHRMVDPSVRDLMFSVQAT